MSNYLEPGEQMRDIGHVQSAEPRMRRLARGLGVLQDIRHLAPSNTATGRKISTKISALMGTLYEYCLEHVELLPPHCTVDWFHPGPLVTPDNDTLLEALNEQNQSASVDANGIVTLRPATGPPIDAKRLLMDGTLYTW